MEKKVSTKGESSNGIKPAVSSSLPNGYCFKNEHGNKVTVVEVRGGWCLVREEGKKNEYRLPTSFILAIHSEGNDC